MDFNASVLVLAHPTPECSVCAGKSYSKPWLYANGTLGVREVNAPFTPQSDSCQLNLCRHDLSSMTFSKKKKEHPTMRLPTLPPSDTETRRRYNELSSTTKKPSSVFLFFSFHLSCFEGLRKRKPVCVTNR